MVQKYKIIEQKLHGSATILHLPTIMFACHTRREKDVFQLLLCHNFCLFQKNHNFAQYNYN